MVCLEAHIEFSPGLVAGILDTIRTRVLNFALEIEKVAPDAGEVAPDALDLPAGRVDSLFQTFVINPAGPLTIGGGTAVGEAIVTVVPGDVASLRTALAQLGVASDDVADLESALDRDRAAETRMLGPETASWLQRFAGRAVSVGQGVTASVISSLLSRWLGLS